MWLLLGQVFQLWATTTEEDAALVRGAVVYAEGEDGYFRIGLEPGGMGGRSRVRATEEGWTFVLHRDM